MSINRLSWARLKKGVCDSASGQRGSDVEIGDCSVTGCAGVLVRKRCNFTGGRRRLFFEVNLTQARLNIDTYQASFVIIIVVVTNGVVVVVIDVGDRCDGCCCRRGRHNAAVAVRCGRSVVGHARH